MHTEHDYSAVVGAIKSLPFAAPNPFTKDLTAQSPNIRFQFILANDQHYSIVDAIRNREGTRAAALTLEHARSAWKHMRSTPLAPLVPTAVHN